MYITFCDSELSKLYLEFFWFRHNNSFVFAAGNRPVNLSQVTLTTIAYHVVTNGKCSSVWRTVSNFINKTSTNKESGKSKQRPPTI